MKIDKVVRERGLAILLHPQPVVIPKGFWSEWKKVKEPVQRLELVKRYGLAKDDKVFALTRIIIDIDQPYESAERVVLKIFEKLGIDRGYALGKTKSGNLRGVLWLEPSTVTYRETVDGKQIQRVRTLYLRPNARHKNGHTHYQNFREYLAILYGLLEREGLKVDWTFFDRVNHSFMSCIAEPSGCRRRRICGSFPRGDSPLTLPSISGPACGGRGT